MIFTNIGVFSLTTATIVDMIMKHACVCPGHVWLRIVLNNVCYMWRFYSQTISGETELNMKKKHSQQTMLGWVCMGVRALCVMYNTRLPIYLNIATVSSNHMNIQCCFPFTWKIIWRRGLLGFSFYLIRVQCVCVLRERDMINKRLIWMLRIFGAQCALHVHWASTHRYVEWNMRHVWLI